MIVPKRGGHRVDLATIGHRALHGAAARALANAAEQAKAAAHFLLDSL